ncbi:MAG: carboxypeptidase regulatory-like domain-containing protein [Bryobacteraceae bacterium]
MAKRNFNAGPVVSLIILLALFGFSAVAQTTSGTITGTVVDQSGAIVPGAKVTITDESTRDTRDAVGSDSGEFVFAAVRPSTYTISVEKPGFQRFSQTGIVLATSQRLALGDVRLSVGQSSESVTITAQAPSVNTEGADTAPAIDQVQLNNIPVAGRDVMNLLRVLPGVGSMAMAPWGEIPASDPAGTASNGGQFGSFTPNVGGARLFWNTVLVDGQVGSNPDFPGLFMAAISMDAVSEAKIISHNYTAEYGRNPGPTISLVTKSGTNQFHGAVYSYFRNEDLNANDFFNNRDGLPKPEYRFSTIGVALGGPIFIPGHFNTDRRKLFFFFSHENWGTKLPQGITRVTVPTAAERSGDFSQSLDQSGALRVITDPTTGAPFPGNKIPADRVNSNGLLMMNLMPLPNRLDRSVTQGAYNYEWQDSCDIPKRLDSLKLDYYPHEKDLISIHPRSWFSDTRAYGCRTLGYGGNLPIFKSHYKYLTNSAVINWTHTINPTMINEFGIGFTGEKERSPADNLFGRTVANYFDPVRRDKQGFTLGQLYPAANEYNILPQAFFNFAPDAPSITAEARFPDHQGYERFHFLDNFSIIRNKHTFKFGVYFERNWATDGPHADCFDGCFDFTHDIYNPLDTGWDFANAYIGNFRAYRESNTRLPYQAQANMAEWFAQDTWKVAKNLTIDVGVRFSWFTPWHVGKGLGAEFVQSRYDPSQVPPLYRPALDASGNQVAQNPVTGALAPAVYIGAFTGPFNFPGMVLSTDKSYPAGFREQHGVQPAPRIGFAWDPFGDGKTSVRGGFGILKETLPTYNSYFWSMVSNPPVQIEPQIFYGSMNTLLQRQGLLFPVGSSSIQLKDKVPSIYKYSLGIQRQVNKDLSMDVSYVGNQARHLIQGININEVPYGAHFLPQNQDPTSGGALPEDFYRPYPGYEGIGQMGNFGWSNYNSLQVAVNKRYAHGIQFGLSYTWSRAMGTGSNDGDTLATYRPWRIWNYGPTLFDQRQILTMTYVWDLPKASRLLPNPLVKGAFDNWQLSGVCTFAKGLPTGVYGSTSDGADITGGGDGWRPNLVANAYQGGGSFYQWFNTAAFARPAQGYYGNSPVYPIYGPGQNNWDITLMKKFPLWSEHRALEFRGEFYNAFNHTQYDAVDSNAVFDPTGAQINGEFGQVVATRSPRIIQLSLRLEF